MSKKKRKEHYVAPYAAFNILMASRIEPMPEKAMTTYLNVIDTSVERLRSDEGGTLQDWYVLSDAINLIDVFHQWEWVPAETAPLLKQAAQALINAGIEIGKTKKLRLEGDNLKHIRHFLDDYEELIAGVSARSFMVAANKMAKELWDVRHGKKVDGVIEVDVGL